MAVTYATPGSNKATISFTAPSTAIDGTPLTGNLTLSVAYDYVQSVTKFNAVKPGEKYTFTDNLETGHHKVDVWLLNEAGKGLRAHTTTFTGHDLPGAVTDLTFSIDNMKAKVNWNAPTTGINGGYFPTEELL